MVMSMTDILETGARLSHARTEISRLARDLHDALALGLAPRADLLPELNAWLTAEAAARGELAERLAEHLEPEVERKAA